MLTMEVSGAERKLRVLQWAGMVGKGLRGGAWNSWKIRSAWHKWSWRDQPCVDNGFLGFEAWTYRQRRHVPSAESVSSDVSGSPSENHKALISWVVWLFCQLPSPSEESKMADPRVTVHHNSCDEVMIRRSIGGEQSSSEHAGRFQCYETNEGGKQLMCLRFQDCEFLSSLLRYDILMQ